MIRRLTILEAGLVLTMLSSQYSTSPGETVLVSTDSSGQAGNGSSWETAISADGRYVAYASWATNLVPEDTRVPYWGARDVLVYDLGTQETTRVSVDSAGNQANGCSRAPTISADGRYVAFESDASNLVPGDSNEVSDVFVHDLWTGETTRVEYQQRWRAGRTRELRSQHQRGWPICSLCLRRHQSGAY